MSSTTIDGGPGTVTPINTATDTPGKPIPVGPGPATRSWSPRTGNPLRRGHVPVTPINTATNTPGTPIRIPSGPARAIAITPDGKTLYVVTGRPFTVIPISTATDTAGNPIRIGAPRAPSQMAITPDGKTLYVVNPDVPRRGHPDQHGHQHGRHADPHR